MGIAPLLLPKLPDVKEFFAQVPRWFWRIGQAGQQFFIELWFKMGFKKDKIRITDWQVAEMCGRSLRWAQKAIRQLLDFMLDDETPFPLINRYRVYGRRNESGRIIEIIVDFRDPKAKAEPKGKAKAGSKVAQPAGLAASLVNLTAAELAEPTAEEQREAAERLRELVAKNRAEQAAGRRSGPSLAGSVTVSPELAREREAAELARIEAIPPDQRSELLETIRVRLAAKLGSPGSRPARE
jgi:hypothetical protein